MSELTSRGEAIWKEYVEPSLGEPNTAVHINVAEIPDHVRDSLAAATLDLIRDILRNPDSRAILEARIKAKKDAALQNNSRKEHENGKE